jgi:hypothetical protein
VFGVSAVHTTTKESHHCPPRPPPPTDAANVTITRKNCQTGTRVTVTKDGDTWLTVCEDHETKTEHKSRSARDIAARTPADWCAGCAKALRAAESKAAPEEQTVATA